MEDIFRGLGIEITFERQDDFLKIAETLTRIGISSRKDQTLFQSCHILHKQGRYAILHFKEMFILDGKKNTITDDDLARRNTIVKLLEEWKLLKINTPELIQDLQAGLNQIKIISHADKKNWILTPKYSIGTIK